MAVREEYTEGGAVSCGARTMTNTQIEAWIAGFRVTMPMRQISTQTGLSCAHLYRLAAGDIRRPSYDTVERLQRLENNSSFVSHMRQKRA